MRDVWDDSFKYEYVSEDYFNKIKTLVNEYIKLFETEVIRIRQIFEKATERFQPKEGWRRE